MAHTAGAGHVLPFYVDADATPNPGGFPVGGQTPLDLPNNHLQYAITWYALAGVLIVFYILVVRRRRASSSPQPGASP
jgi:surfeit locus 1 family protein